MPERIRQLSSTLAATSRFCHITSEFPSLVSKTRKVRYSDHQPSGSFFQYLPFDFEAVHRIGVRAPKSRLLPSYLRPELQTQLRIEVLASTTVSKR
jgi:hypothetical protein